MQQATCKNCGKTRDVVRQRDHHPLCQKCSGIARRKPLPTCDLCGKSKKSYAKLCMDCYNKTRPNHPKDGVEVCCDICFELRTLRAKPLKASATCRSCAANKRMETVDMPRHTVRVPIRHYRVCTKCGLSAQVASAKKAGIVHECRACKPRKIKPPKKKVVAKQKPVKKDNLTSTAEIKRLQRINRRHKEKLENKPEIQQVVQRLTDEEMIAKFLETKEPTDGGNTW